MITQLEMPQSEAADPPPAIPPFVTYLTTFVRWSNRLLIPFYIYSMCVDLPHAQLYALRGMVCLMCLMFQGLVVVLNKQVAKGEVHSDCKNSMQVVLILSVLWVLSPLFSIVSLLDGNFLIAIVFILNCLCLSAVYIWILQRPLRQVSATTGCSDSEMILFLLVGVVLFAFGIYKAHNLLKVEALTRLQNATFVH